MIRRLSIKNLITVILVVFILLSAALVLSDEAFAATTATVNSSIGVNIRSGPGTNYSVLIAVENNTVLNVIEQTGDWYKVTYKTYTGYVNKNYVIISEDKDYVYDSDFEAYLTAQGFPESYKVYLRTLHSSHPEWVFKAQITNLSWSDVIAKESEIGKNLVSKNAKDSWKSQEYGAIDSNGNYIEFDSGGWVAASKAIVEYYMDPRNFLTESGIFQFMSQSYDSNTQTKSGLQQIVAGTFLNNKFPEAGYDTYSDVLIYAAQQSGANPYVLASMILTEQGTNGTGKSISGTVSGYEGYYNFFNVRAYASGSYDAVQYGLLYAKGSGSYDRPWNTRLKSIVGGAKYYATNYINNNQNTLYLKKFNVMNGLNNVATHQYMTNVGGAASEASSLYKAYSQISAVTFYIPVYTNMPTESCPLPTSGNSNNYLNSLEVAGYSLTPVFNKYTTQYEITVPSTVTAVSVNAVTSDAGAKVSGTGNVTLTGSVTTISVNVTATNGEVKTYTITVAKEAESSTGVMESSTYNIGSTITGVGFDTSVATFKSNIKIPSGYTLKVTNASGTELTTGNVGTGTKATLYNANSKLVQTKEIVIKGDVNGDGKVTSVDPLMIKRHIIGTYNLSGVYLTAADINGDGKVTSVDPLMVKRHIIGTYTINN